MKVIIAILLCSMLSYEYVRAAPMAANAPAPMVSFMGFPPTQFFHDFILQSEAQKLLTQPAFPADLQQRVLDAMNNAEMGFNGCNSAMATLPWFQIRCVVLQLSKSKSELKAIDDEAKVRATAVVAAAAAGASASASASASDASASVNDASGSWSI